MGTDDDQITEVGGTDSSALDHMSSWIELFYDLIFVAAILILSTAVTHVHPSSGAAWVVLVFAGVMVGVVHHHVVRQPISHGRRHPVEVPQPRRLRIGNPRQPGNDRTNPIGNIPYEAAISRDSRSKQLPNQEA